MHHLLHLDEQLTKERAAGLEQLIKQGMEQSLQCGVIDLMEDAVDRETAKPSDSLAGLPTTVLESSNSVPHLPTSLPMP